MSDEMSDDAIIVYQEIVDLKSWNSDLWVTQYEDGAGFSFLSPVGRSCGFSYTVDDKGYAAFVQDIDAIIAALQHLRDRVSSSNGDPLS